MIALSDTELDAMRAYFRIMDAIIAAALVDEATADKLKDFLNAVELSTPTLASAHALIDAARQDRRDHCRHH